MSSQYKVRALYWSYHDGYYLLKHQGELENLLNDGWEISRVDAISPTNFPSGEFGATNVYVLEKQSEEKQSEDTKKSSVSEFPRMTWVYVWESSRMTWVYVWNSTRTEHTT